MPGCQFKVAKNKRGDEESRGTDHRHDHHQIVDTDTYNDTDTNTDEDAETVASSSLSFRCSLIGLSVAIVAQAIVLQAVSGAEQGVLK